MTQLDQQISYLFRLERFGIKPGLNTMRHLMSALGNPHTQVPSIHIAGTNGKGSTAALLASALNRTDLTVGLYTSPYIYHFNERIRVSQREITDVELSNLITKVRSAAGEHNLTPTFFEFATALTFLHFARQSVDLAVIEVGLGGRYDATNIITPLISIITNIGLDHTQWLGTSHRAIAEQKAGIIKPGVPVVTAETDPGILAYFEQVCRENNTALYPVQNHLKATVTKESLAGQTFKVSGKTPGVNEKITIPLLGEHQVTNALTALLTLHVLNLAAGSVAAPAIKQGFAQTSSPGRLDLVSRDPFILADGAHNPDGVRALAHFLDTHDLPQPDILVVGAKQDKDITALLDLITPRFRRVITTEGNYQPMPAAALATLLHPKGVTKVKTQAIPDLGLALKTAQAELKPGAMLLITGSLYLVGDALTILRSKKSAT